MIELTDRMKQLLPSNTFSTNTYAPIGNKTELYNAFLEIVQNDASIRQMSTVETGIYRLEVTTSDTNYIFWVNEIWYNILLSEFKFPEEAYSDLNSELVNIIKYIKKGLVTIEFMIPCPDSDYVGIRFKGNSGVKDAKVSYARANSLIELLKSSLIPVNSNSLLVKETSSRFSGATWYEQIQSKYVTLVGVGGIGSYVGFLISRLNPAGLFIYDPDVVEAVNMSGQLYSLEDIGKNKVDALASMIHIYASSCNLMAFPRVFNHLESATDITICGLDNMTSRQQVFNRWMHWTQGYEENERGKCLFIDGRLAAEEFQVFAIKGNDTRAIEKYRNEWLFSDREAEETVCSYKQTTHIANMIASVMVNLFVNFVANECNPVIDRDVPFMTYYSAETMFFKVEM